MAEGFEPQPVGYNVIYLGEITDLNIANRKAGALHIGIYSGVNTGHPPVENKGGTTLLFTNAGYDRFGVQLAFTDNATTIYKRLLVAGEYQSWSAA